jgi:hypothetical protein
LSDNSAASTGAAVGTLRSVKTIVLVGGPRGLPTAGSFDARPLIWGVFLIVEAWALGLRLRAWSLLPIAMAGLLSTTMSSHYGLWAPPSVAAVVFLILIRLQRVPRRG